MCPLVTSGLFTGSTWPVGLKSCCATLPFLQGPDRSNPFLKIFSYSERQYGARVKGLRLELLHSNPGSSTYLVWDHRQVVSYLYAHILTCEMVSTIRVSTL